MIRVGVLVAVLVILCAHVDAAGCGASKNTWATKRYGGTWRFTKDGQPTVLRGVSMTGWETGTRTEQSGGGYWLFEVSSAADGKKIMTNIIDVLVSSWGMNIIRMPICGSAWTQNYEMQSYMTGGSLNVKYHEWVDQAVCYAVSKGMVTIIDNHLWAIAKETTTTRNTAMEDGCTGYETAPPGHTVNSCAPKDWFGAYTSARTSKQWGSGDSTSVWQCPLANADGCTLSNLFRGDNIEHFYDLWYDVATYFKGTSAVWFELFNEPYERKSAEFGVEDPLGPGLGDNIPEASYAWNNWKTYNYEAIKIIRKITDQIILISGHDWNYDYLGDHSSETPGPLLRPQALMPWVADGVANIAYAFHPYQHGTCCGKIGRDSDLSVSDPYQSAYCMYAPKDSSGQRTVSNSELPTAVEGKTCDTRGYAETVNKKSPPCTWKAAAKMFPLTTTGVCAGDRDECAYLSQDLCEAKSKRWSETEAGGWSKYVLPMQIYGPLIATEHGPFDCSSPYETSFTDFCRRFGISYTVWALWPQNSGGPGAGSCGYPSIMQPLSGGNFKTCLNSCTLTALPWSGPVVAKDIKSTTGNCAQPCQHGMCVSGSCVCKTGYSGSYCETKQSGFSPCSENPCENGGTCHVIGSETYSADADTWICKCSSDWSGARCNVPNSMHSAKPTCSTGICKNGGTCVEAGYQVVCKCDPQYTGADCSKMISSFATPTMHVLSDDSHDVDTASSSSSSSHVVVVFALIAAVAVVALITGFVLYRRRRVADPLAYEHMLPAQAQQQ